MGFTLYFRFVITPPRMTVSVFAYNASTGGLSGPLSSIRNSILVHHPAQERYRQILAKDSREVCSVIALELRILIGWY